MRDSLVPLAVLWWDRVFSSASTSPSNCGGCTSRYGTPQTCAVRRPAGSPLLSTLAGLAEVHLEEGDMGAARACLDEMLALLFPEEGQQREHVAAGLACYRILRAAGEEERARELLRYAVERLQEDSARIESEELRRSFLERIGMNREVITASREVSGRGL